MNRDVIKSNWLCTHGVYDDILYYNTSKEQVELLQNGGFDIEFKSYEKDHSIDRDELEMISKWMRNIIDN